MRFLLYISAICIPFICMHRFNQCLNLNVIVLISSVPAMSYPSSRYVHDSHIAGTNTCPQSGVNNSKIRKNERVTKVNFVIAILFIASSVMFFAYKLLEAFPVHNFEANLHFFSYDEVIIYQVTVRYIFMYIFI